MKFKLANKDGTPLHLGLVNKILDAIGHKHVADIPIIEEGIIYPTIEILDEEYERTLFKIQKVLGFPEHLDIEFNGPIPPFTEGKFPTKISILYKGEF